MGDGDARLGNQFFEAVRDSGDRADAVVNVEHLAFAQKFPSDGGSNLFIGVFPHVRQDGVAFLGWGCQRRHFADSGDRHLECARDRGGAHRQHVDVGLELLQCFLVLDTEALFLVDDDEPEVLEVDARRQQAVRSDDDIERSVTQRCDRVLRLSVGLESRQRSEPHGETGKSIAERFGVLTHEQGGRRDDRNLLARHDGLEGRTNGDLGLAEPNITGQKAVHRDLAFHVGLDLVDRRELVGGLVVRERVLEFALPRGVRREREPLRLSTGGIQFDQFDGDLADCLAGATLCRRPVRPAHLRQGRVFATDIPRHQRQLVGRHVQLVAGESALARRIFDDQVFTLRLRLGSGVDNDVSLDHLDESTDSVGFVNDVVTGNQRQRVNGQLAPGSEAGRILGDAGFTATEELGLAHDRQSGVCEFDAVVDSAGNQIRDAGLNRLGHRVDGAGSESSLGQQVARTVEGSVTCRDDDDDSASGQPFGGEGDGAIGVAHE